MLKNLGFGSLTCFQIYTGNYIQHTSTAEINVFFFTGTSTLKTNIGR